MPKDSTKQNPDDNKYFALTNEATVTVRLTQPISIDGIGFETGGDDDKMSHRTPRRVEVQYKDSNSAMVDLGTFDTSDLVGKSYQLKQFATKHVESDEFTFYFKSHPD